MIVDNQDQIFQDVENINVDGVNTNPENLAFHETHVYEFDFMQIVVDGPETGLRKKKHWNCKGIIYRIIK
jgi:hypothetical protein